jgi:predicted lipase
MSDTVFTFDPGNSFHGFDSKVALELAKLTNQAYKQFDASQANPTEQWKPQDYDLVKEFKDGDDPFGFVASRIAENDKTDIFIVFRGTRKLIEWFKDGNIPLVSYAEGKDQDGEILRAGNILGKFAAIFEKNDSPILISTDQDYGRVALGFRQIYTSLRSQIINAVNKCSNVSRIFVTGHSLGGALATLAIPDILHNIEFANPENVILYTFASPRCGNNTFAVSFRNSGVKHWRIANTEDLVPMIPFPTGNVFHIPDTSKESPELDILDLPYGKTDSLGIGGVAGVDKNPNPIFGFFKAMYDRNKRRMPNYSHTGTPIYFTVHAPALEKLHSLVESYIPGISRV